MFKFTLSLLLLCCLYKATGQQMAFVEVNAPTFKGASSMVFTSGTSGYIPVDKETYLVIGSFGYKYALTLEKKDSETIVAEKKNLPEFNGSKILIIGYFEYQGKYYLSATCKSKGEGLIYILAYEIDLKTLIVNEKPFVLFKHDSKFDYNYIIRHVNNSILAIEMTDKWEGVKKGKFHYTPLGDRGKKNPDKSGFN